MNNVSTGGYLSLEEHIRVPATARQLETFQLNFGDVLFNSTNSPELVGKSAIFEGYDEPVVFSNHFLRLRPDQARLTPEYLARWLTYQWQQRTFQKLCTQWVNQAAVRRDDLLALPIVLPSLPEQRKHASLLDRADRLRRTRRYAQEISDIVLRAVFLEMFCAFVDTGLSVPLGELATILGGGTPPRHKVEFYNGRIPWVTPKDMRSFYIDDTNEHVTEEAIRRSATKLVPVGSVLIVVKSKVLMHRVPIALTRTVVCHNQDIKAILCSQEIDPLFLISVLRHSEGNLLQQARGANTEGLTLPMLEELKVPHVPKGQQDKFAQIAARVERLRAQQREAERQAEHLFQTLLHRAFAT